MTYTKFELPNGKGTRYRFNNRLIKAADVPPEEMARLNDEPLPEPKAKLCIFCGAHGKYQRLVNLQTVDICEQHYYSESVGKIAQKLREVQDA